MIEGWHKRTAAILTEHQLQLERFTKIQQVEKTKQLLLIKNYLFAEETENSSPKYVKEKSKNNQNDENTTYTEAQSRLLNNCIKLIKQGIKFKTCEEKKQEVTTNVRLNVIFNPISFIFLSLTYIFSNLSLTNNNQSKIETFKLKVSQFSTVLIVTVSNRIIKIKYNIRSRKAHHESETVFKHRFRKRIRQLDKIKL